MARHWCTWHSTLIKHILAAFTSVAIVGSMACFTTSEQSQPAQDISVPSATGMTPAAPQVAAVPKTSFPRSTPIPNATPTSMPTATLTPLPAPTATPTPLPTATPVPSPTPIPTPAGPVVSIGGTIFTAEVADTPALRSKGLGERDSLDEQTGMLFVFPEGHTSSFWMKGMRFPLDFVWIGEDCTVVDLTQNVQHSPPDTPTSQLDLFNSSTPAAYTFEINAGEVSRFGINVGDHVSFHGIDSEFAKCCESGVCDGK